MSSPKKITRRNVIKAGLATLASAGIITPEGNAALPKDIKPKARGETKVIFLGGDVLHNFMAQEPALRRICERAGWKFYSVHDARYVTPELISDADLMMIERWVGGVPGWIPGPIFESAPENDQYMTDELEDAIVDNVTNRGMAFMSIHCCIWAMAKKKFTNMLGVNAIIHGPLQTVRCHNFNQNHPITKGMKDFDIPIDENFGAEITDPDTIPLYETFGLDDKRQDYGGWCTEKNNGRVCGFLAGHTYFAFQNPNYLELFRRGAYWALKKDIPAKG